MDEYKIIKIGEYKELIPEAAAWFHAKWGVPEEAYLESMKESCPNDAATPQWYVILEHNTIIAGIGVIKNDFHDRKDLSPNICAVFVEPEYRKQGIGGKMLNFVCADFQAMHVETLYLITDHTSFYEKYGWEFLCMVQGDGEATMTRMYRHQS